MMKATIILAVAASLILTGCLQASDYNKITTNNQSQPDDTYPNKITDNKTTIIIEPTPSPTESTTASGSGIPSNEGQLPPGENHWKPEPTPTSEPKQISNLEEQCAIWDASTQPFTAHKYNNTICIIIAGSDSMAYVNKTNGILGMDINWRDRTQYLLAKSTFIHDPIMMIESNDTQTGNITIDCLSTTLNRTYRAFQWTNYTFLKQPEIKTILPELDGERFHTAATNQTIYDSPQNCLITISNEKIQTTFKLEYTAITNYSYWERKTIE